jgi:tetratricopeptide (TPR) repeat protein
MIKVRGRSFPISIISASINLSLCLTLIMLNSTWANARTFDATQTEIMPLAKQYLAENKFPQARNLLETMLSLEPYNAEAHLLFGKALLLERNYQAAWRELRQASQLASDKSVAKKANDLIGELPMRLRQPTPCGCLAKDETATSEGLAPTLNLRHNATLLVFTTPWQEQSNAFATMVKRITSEPGSNCSYKIVSLGTPGSNDLFELFSVSQIPAVVTLNSKGEFADGAAANLTETHLRSLVKAASK